MAKNQETLVFRCGWTWWRVLAVTGGALFLALALYYFSEITKIFFHIAGITQVPGASVAARGWFGVAKGLLILAIIMTFGPIAFLLSRFRHMWAVVHRWQAEVGPNALSITSKDGGTMDVAWEDIERLDLVSFPQMRTANGAIAFPPGIADGRRLFALIAERAGLTERKGSWITGVRLTRPSTQRGA